MHEVELVLGLLVAVAALATAARYIGVPYPILLVLGGLVLGFIPGLPNVELAPDTVFLLFLPPILFSAAYSTDLRAFLANRRPILLLSVWLVLITTVAVAAVAHAVIDGMTWPTAFVLGAIVSPPDAVATVAIVQRLGIPRRLITVLEGESLVNDATALVAFRFAVMAVVTGSFSLWEMSWRFPVVAVGGVAIGIAVGFALVWVVGHLDDPSVGILATLLAPVVAYIPAEELGVSGVLATVTAGLIMGRRSVSVFDAGARIRGLAVWEFIIFVINGLVFILIGLQLRAVVDALSGYSASELFWDAAAVSLATIFARILYMYPATYLPRFLFPALRRNDPYPPWQYPTLLAYSGLRGVVTLAAALALPLETDANTPFPNRDLIIFLSFAVILVTLVGQGLSLPALVRWLGIADDGAAGREEIFARREAAMAAIARLDELIEEDWTEDKAVAKMRYRYEHRLAHLPDSLNPEDGDRDHIDSHERLRREVLEIERSTIITLRNRGAISDQILHRIERDLDLEEERSEI